MQFEDKSDDKQVLLSPTKKISSTTETLKIIVSDVVVDLSQAAKSSSSTSSSSFQMMYVDLKWRNKSLRTVASAKKLENTASKTSSSSTSSSSHTNNSKQSSTFSGERTEFVVKSSSASPQEDGTDDVMVVTLRRCEVFGDSDLSCVAFRLSDVPWIKRSPIVVIAGPFMLSLQAETFGYELPPELTLAERIDAVGGPVEVVVGTGDRARAKQVPMPPSDESLKRKAILNSDKGLDGPTRRKNRDESDPLGDGTAEAVDRRRQKQQELAELRRREEEEKNGKKNGEERTKNKEDDEGPQKNDGNEHNDDDNNKQNRLPPEVQQVIDCQIPPEPPVLATLGIDLEIAPCSNNDKESSGDRFRDPGLLHNAINSAAPALAAAAKHDIDEKLKRDFEGENSSSSSTSAPSSSFNQQQPSSYFNVDLSSINTVVNNNCGNNYHNNNDSNFSTSPMTIVLNVEVKPNERTHLLDPELMEKIRKVLEKESSGSDDGKHALWKSSDFPNVARCIMHNVSDTNSNNEEQSQQEKKEKEAASSSSIEVQTETDENFFCKVECTNCEVSPSLSSNQLAEQQRIINALERRPLEIIANHNLADPSTPLRWRGTLPDERCPLVPVVYKRDKYTVNALISVNLLPILANGRGNKNSNSSSSSSSPSRGFFSALSDKISGAVEKVSSSIDSDRLLSDFPELRSQMWSNGQSTENQKIPVAAVFDCQALNGFGTPLSGKLYMTASEMFFQTSSSVLDSSNNKNPASRIHWRACFANEIVCVRRIVAFGSEAFQVFTRSGTVMQFQEFDGFFARAGLAIGLRTFTKFFAAWMIVLDLWHAWRAPVQSELKK